MDDVHINMLEAAFPYIPSYLKRPVAAILKLQELEKVMTEYNMDEMIHACSLDSGNTSPEQMFYAMKQKATPEIARQIDTMLNAIKMIRIYQSYQTLFNENQDVSSHAKSSSSSNDLLSSLLNDLV